MNASRLLEHFDRISEAPDAIPRLRKFILDLAVRGKLVEQRPDDVPATTLIERIDSERARLARAGELPRRDEISPIDLDEQPFVLPDSWAWIRVGHAFIYDAGMKRDAKDLPAGGWLVDLEDIERDTSVLLVRAKVSDRDSLSTKSEFKEGDVLYGKLRPYLNKVIVADQPGYSTTEIVAIRAFVPLCAPYVCLAFRRPDFVDYVTRLGRGTKMPRLRTEDALTALFPLPPLAEQRRIVAKVDELMGLCDRLEVAREETEVFRRSATRASIGAMASSGTTGARRYLSHIEELTARPEQIELLRSAVIDLALRGHLVESDAADQSADELLRRLTERIEESRKQSGLATPTAAPIEPDEVPFTVPNGWVWTRLSSLFNTITDGDHLPPPRADQGVAFLTIGNVSSGTIDFSDCRLVPPEYFRSLSLHRRPAPGDILYTVVGATYGRPVIVDTDREFCVQRHIAILKPAVGVNLRFLFLLLKSSLVYRQASRSITGTAQPTIPIRALRDLVVPVPPVEEQERIVTKVDALMDMCRELAHVQERAATAMGLFLGASMRAMLAPAD